MLFRFSIHNVEKKLLEFLVRSAATQRLHDVKLQIAAETWTQFTVTGETKFVAALAEMQVGHRPDKAEALFAVRNLIVGCRAVCSKF